MGCFATWKADRSNSHDPSGVDSWVRRRRCAGGGRHDARGDHAHWDRFAGDAHGDVQPAASDRTIATGIALYHCMNVQSGQ